MLMVESMKNIVVEIVCSLNREEYTQSKKVQVQI